MEEYILLTGGTGFLGTELASRLAGMPEVKKIYVLVRAANQAEGLHRLRAAWYHNPALNQSIGDRCIPVPGDFTKPGLGMIPDISAKSEPEVTSGVSAKTESGMIPGISAKSEPEVTSGDWAELREHVTLVIHAGAEIGFQKSRQEMRATNVLGTKNMLLFARRLPKLRRFVHISTAYVAGQNRGVILEKATDATRFSSYYEKTKAQAETLVRASGLPFTICRPGMIVGDTRTGRVRNFNTIYYVLKQMLLGKMPVLPVGAESPVNLVPVDYVADCITRISFRPEAAGKYFHLTCPGAMAPKTGELTDHVRKWAEKKLSVHLAKPVFLPVPAMKQAGQLYNSQKSSDGKSDLSNLLTLMPYFSEDHIFDRTNTETVCGTAFPDWHEYIDRLLAFACRKNFMRQDGLTIFEQAQIRRESKRHPINYYDVSAEGIRKVTGPEANRRIDRICQAFRAWGIRKGDRIALTGINSVDYMTLEQAIGLTGAVSVPLYYTTPADEVSLLLEKSGARWFFVGDRRMMEQIPQIQTDARIVSFSAGETVRHPAVMRWREFLKAEASSEQSGFPACEAPTAAGVSAVPKKPAASGVSTGSESATDPISENAAAIAPDPEDLATIRYTSGTTGEPKGVMFSYGQLAWMGEVLTNLLPWKDRNTHMSYLSFLPLSHVVEGILASYAPYYMVAKVDYYYLNDFGSLTDALPKVRPTVFFSVPRFYEKVWDQVTANKLGQAWLAAEKGPAKEAMAAILRPAVLKKAGIDRCRQLIVGSAPVSETLLLNFRALGIEIHNAYGQTEAPLITINRLGDNRIPTIGTPLPDTTVTVEPDGELIVRGPQVALGYYGLETDTIHDGVLRTGDLGVIHRNGHITLHGRKKDFIITAYGKNISIPKLEERLKDIPGVSEAVLVGENRPYCTALLWLEEGSRPANGENATEPNAQTEVPDKGLTELDAQIAIINTGLSHPEQIKKYRVIPTPLSIAAGELTPNLKVKRNNVYEHYAREIEEMYS